MYATEAQLTEWRCSSIMPGPPLSVLEVFREGGGWSVAISVPGRGWAGLRGAPSPAAWIYQLDPMLRSVLEMQFGVLFEPLVSEIHLAGRRHVDIRSPENFFTITQVPPSALSALFSQPNRNLVGSSIGKK